MKCYQIEKKIDILNIVYKNPTCDSIWACADFDMSDNKQVLLTVNTLISFAFKNSLYFMKKHFDFFFKMDNWHFPATIISNYFLHFSPCGPSIISTILYSPMVSLFLLLISLIIGIIIKHEVFIWNFFVWLFILCIILIFMGYYISFYFHSFIFNSWLMFVLSMINLFEHQNKK